MARRILKWTAAVVVLAGAAYFLDLRRALDDLARLSAWGVVLAVALCSAHFLILALRWHLLLDLPGVPLRANLKIYLYGNFLNSFTPANLGGDVYRFAALRKVAPGGGYVFGCLVEERLLGLFFFFVGYVLFCLGALALGPVNPAFLDAAWFCAAAAAGMLLLPRCNDLLRRLLRGRISGDMMRVLESARLGRTLVPSRRLALYAALSLAAVGLWAGVAYSVSVDMGCPLSWPMIGAVAILVELARFVPLTVQGIGVREAAYAFLFGLCGQSPETGFTVGALTYIILNVVFVLNGLSSLLLGRAAPEGGAEYSKTNGERDD